MSGICKKAGWFGLFLMSAIVAASLITLSSVAAEPFTVEVTSVAPALDERTNKPLITFRMSPNSAHRFAQITSNNIGRRMEIRIDGFVVMEPIIREPVLGGSVQISDPSWTLQQTQDLADRLLSGKARLEFEIMSDQPPPANFR